MQHRGDLISLGIIAPHRLTDQHTIFEKPLFFVQGLFEAALTWMRLHIQTDGGGLARIFHTFCRPDSESKTGNGINVYFSHGHKNSLSPPARQVRFLGFDAQANRPSA